MLDPTGASLEDLRVDREDRRELYLTAAPVGARGRSPAEATREVYRALVDALRGDSSSVVFERIYADRESWNEVVAARREAVGDDPGFAGVAESLFDGGPCLGGGLAGVQMWAISGSTVVPVRENGTTLGCRYQTSEGTYLALSRLSTEPAGDRREFAGRMFRRALELVDAQGFQARTDILRTWIYLQDILDWYDDFNYARSRVYHAAGITSPEGFLPASTGIGLDLPDGMPSIMDVLALRPEPGAGVQVKRCYNPLQNEAPEYGSAFTRGTELTAGGFRTVLISGTAAIDEKGRTIHQGDASKQIVRTVRNIRALLEQSGLSWDEIAQGTIFLPSRDLQPICEEVFASLGLSRRGFLEVVGIVCRDDLLVEIEATAVGPARGEGACS